MKLPLARKARRSLRLKKQIDRFREDRQAVLDDNVAASRKAYVRFLRDARSPFVGLDGNRYGSGGIRSIKDRAAEIKGENTTDQIGVKAVREHYEDLIAKKEEALEYASLHPQELGGFARCCRRQLLHKMLGKGRLCRLSNSHGLRHC
jgi:hypothetical protein